MSSSKDMICCSEGKIFGLAFNAKATLKDWTSSLT